MIGHYITVAWRDLIANKLQSALAITGLALGLAAAIIAALIISNETQYDSFLPLHERLYFVGTEVWTAGQPPTAIPGTSHDEADKLVSSLPQIEAVSRVGIDFHPFRHGTIRGGELAYSADPNIFDLLRFHVLYGDLKHALVRPDTIVIPLSVARKYFGTDNAVGQTLLLETDHVMRVVAVVADLPENGSNLRSAVFISGKPAWTGLGKADGSPPNGPHKFVLDTQTFVRLAPGASASEIQNRMSALNRMLLPRSSGVQADPRLVSITALHTSPDFSPGVSNRLAAFSAIALVILALSSVNFVNLLTARAGRRNKEVGMRKALGAPRRVLVAQFLGEAVIQALIALLFALAIVEWALPAINASLQTGASLHYGPYGEVAAMILAGTIFVGLIAGFYPALLLSALHPIQVLRGASPVEGKVAPVRRLLVILQFALLTALIIGAGILLAQYHFALTRTLDHADRILLVSVPDCHAKIADEIAAMPGVEDTACTDISFIRDISWIMAVKRPDGNDAALDDVTVTPKLLHMYGEQPIAGRDFLPSDWIEGESKTGQGPIKIIINQASLGVLGIPTPTAAIGRVLHLDEAELPKTAVIVGVVRNFSAYALEKPVAPTAYSYRKPDVGMDTFLTVKLTSRSNETVLKAIDRQWSQSNSEAPFQRIFMNDFIASQRIDLLHEQQAFTALAAVALLLGCLGLFGLSVAEAQRRIKEIGVRKAMGAENGNVLGLLLWQFAQPVLLANFVAWPLAFWLMNRWLSGFAYHVAMPLWLFPVAGFITMVVALLTVAGQSWFAARQKPVLALRYE